MLTPSEIDQLRQTYYNADVVDIIQINDDLGIFCVRHDRGPIAFASGQYGVLGLGMWEPRTQGAQQEVVSADQLRRLAKRAYSISCPMIDAEGRLVRSGDIDHLEFYIALVRRAEGRPPALTPRLFALRPGDRLWMGEKAKGSYRLHAHGPNDAVVFISTGTGEAPHNAMLPELLAGGRQGPIVNLTCVRHRSDLGYLAQHRRLKQQFANYRYLALTTREPENLDAARSDYIGKQYPQDVLQSGRLEEALGRPLDPGSSHVYLCGNPAMIGLPVADAHGRHTFPTPTGMCELLTQRGFTLDHAQQVGNVHFERYW